MSELILYTTEDGKAAIQLRAEEGTVWLTQHEMAELFATTKQNVSLHINNILGEGELAGATVKESLTVQTEGSRQVKRSTKLYNLDMILAIGFRVRSSRGIQFRQWAATQDYSPRAVLGCYTPRRVLRCRRVDKHSASTNANNNCR